MSSRERRRRASSTERRPAKRNRGDRGDEPDGPSEAEILELIAQRESYRQARDFGRSDDIRERLRDMGVELYDKEKEWVCSDGRRGTMFTAGAAECQLADEEIEDRIRQREDARHDKDWAIADRIRDELRRAGVELDDKASEWRTAGGRRGTYGGGVVSTASTPGRLNLTSIRKLVADRERLREAKDFEAADDLRRQLSQMGVELYDNERLWKSSDGQQGIIITGGHEVECHLRDREIRDRVAQREEARSSKDWSIADSIRADLRKAGVELLDGQKMWMTTDGRSGAYSGEKLPRGQGGGGGRGGQEPRVQPTQLASALKVAAAAPTRYSHPGAATDAVTTLLQAVGGGTVGGGHPVGAHPVGGGGGGGCYVGGSRAVGAAPASLPTSPVTNAPSVMTLTTASIECLVDGRERCRDARDWQGADSIRDDLRAHGVDVWDNQKIWRANDGRHGQIMRP